jgi:hypothetical protein
VVTPKEVSNMNITDIVCFTLLAITFVGLAVLIVLTIRDER